MLPRILSCFIFFYLLKQSHQAKKPFLLKLTPEQVMQTFDNVMSDDYIKELAKSFAAKAAAHFMNEIRNQKESLAAKLSNEEFRYVLLRIISVQLVCQILQMASPDEAVIDFCA